MVERGPGLQRVDDGLRLLADIERSFFVHLEEDARLFRAVAVGPGEQGRVPEGRDGVVVEVVAVKPQDLTRLPGHAGQVEDGLLHRGRSETAGLVGFAVGSDARGLELVAGVHGGELPRRAAEGEGEEEQGEGSHGATVAEGPRQGQGAGR